MDKKTYQSQWADRPEALLFHQSWWLDAVCGAKNWDCIFLENEAGVFPFFKEKKLKFTLIRPPKLTAYLPPILTDQKIDFLKEISEKLKPYAEFSFTTPAHFHLGAQDTTPFQIYKRRTYILSLKDKPEEIFGRYSSQRKRHIRKAESSLQFSENKFDTSLFIEHHQAAFSKKNKIYPFDYSFIEKIISEGKKNNAVHCIQAQYQDKVIAQIACFFDRHTMYYLLGSFDPEYKKQNAMTALMHRCILKAMAQGLTRFDFEGSSDPGIATFFSQFGSQESFYNVCSHESNFIWKLIKKIRS